MEMNVAADGIGRDLERLMQISTTLHDHHPLLPAPTTTILTGGSDLPSPSASSQRHSGKEDLSTGRLQIRNAADLQEKIWTKTKEDMHEGLED
ncbi:hypothetical protein AgCh_033843 [Apium graveolens]